jgi:hypothetical protein
LELAEKQYLRYGNINRTTFIGVSFHHKYLSEKKNEREVWFQLLPTYPRPNAPAGKESNWVQTIPGKVWNVVLGMYRALESSFDKTWRPGEIQLQPCLDGNFLLTLCWAQFFPGGATADSDINHMPAVTFIKCLD